MKVHKSGSTTLANLLARYALNHDLNVALPDKHPSELRSNYFGTGSFREDQVRPVAAGQKHHVLFNHMIYNRTALDRLMPRDTFYTTIIRHPEKRFVSAVYYYDLLQLPEAVDAFHLLLEKGSFSAVLGEPSARAETGSATSATKRNVQDQTSTTIPCPTATTSSSKLPKKEAYSGNAIASSSRLPGETIFENSAKQRLFDQQKNPDSKPDLKTYALPWKRATDSQISNSTSKPCAANTDTQSAKLKVTTRERAVSRARKNLSQTRVNSQMAKMMDMLRQLTNRGASSQQQSQPSNDSFSALLRQDVRKILQVPEVYNSIAFNSGLPLGQQRDDRAVADHVTKLDREFDLVMVMEHFDESLVLLRRKACLQHRDIVYLKLNSHTKKQAHTLTADSRQALRVWQMADHKIYDFFLNKFQTAVEAMGEDFHQEVLHFCEILKKAHSFCKSHAKFVDALVVKASQWSEEFVLNTHDCDLMTRDELVFQAMLVQRAVQRLQPASSEYSEGLQSSNKVE